MINDPFQVLGVTSSATEDEIKAAYRKLAKKYHPDLHPGSATAEAKMKEINEAYSEAIKIKKGGGTYSSSGGYHSSSQGGYQGGYGGFGGFGGFDFGSFYQAQQQSQQSYQTQQQTYSDPIMQAAADYLRTGRFTDAMRTLNQVIEQPHRGPRARQDRRADGTDQCRIPASAGTAAVHRPGLPAQRHPLRLSERRLRQSLPVLPGDQYAGKMFVRKRVFLLLSQLSRKKALALRVEREEFSFTPFTEWRSILSHYTDD